MIDRKIIQESLIFAAKNGNVDAIILLLGEDDTRVLLDETDISRALHAAIDNNQLGIVLLLIDKADLLLLDDKGKSLLDKMELTTPEIAYLLQEAGVGYLYQQIKLDHNYRALVQLFKEKNILQLTPLNAEGVCNGLSKLFLFYSKQNRLDEFKFFIAFINSLTPVSMQHLVDMYQRNKNIRLKLPHQKKDLPAFNDPEFKEPTFNKLVEFLEGVHKTQKTLFRTNFKSIGANWESTHVICCAKEELAEYIRKSRLFEKTTGEFKLISIIGHSMALHVTDEEVYFYDSNHKKGIQVCVNEETLAKELVTVLNKLKYDTALFFVDILSYGNENALLDELLHEHQSITSVHKNLELVVERYKEGRLSRRDTATELYYQLTHLTDQSNVVPFTEALKRYLENDAEKSARNAITTDVSIINNYNNVYKTGALCYASEHGHFEIVKELVLLGADTSLKNNRLMKPIDFALLYKHDAMIALLKEQQPINTIIESAYKNKAHDATLAQELSYLFDAYANPNFFSFHWRSNREVAAKIANTLLNNPHWNANECMKYIDMQTLNMDMNESGAFKGIINFAKKKIETALGIDTLTYSSHKKAK